MNKLGGKERKREREREREREKNYISNDHVMKLR